MKQKVENRNFEIVYDTVDKKKPIDKAISKILSQNQGSLNHPYVKYNNEFMNKKTKGKRVYICTASHWKIFYFYSSPKKVYFLDIINTKSDLYKMALKERERKQKRKEFFTNCKK